MKRWIRLISAAGAMCLSLALGACASSSSVDEMFGHATKRLDATNSVRLLSSIDLKYSQNGETHSANYQYDVAQVLKPLQLSVKSESIVDGKKNTSNAFLIESDTEGAPPLRYWQINGAAWQVSADPVFSFFSDGQAFYTPENVKLFRDHAGDFRMTGFENVSGIHTVVFEADISGFAMRKIIENTAADRALQDLLLDGAEASAEWKSAWSDAWSGLIEAAPNMSVHVKACFQEQNPLPMRYIVDMGDALDMLAKEQTRLLQAQLKTPVGRAATKLNVPGVKRCIFELDFHDYDNVPPIVLPLDAANAQDLAGRK